MALTDLEKQAIRKTWSIVAKNPRDNGVNLYKKFFREFPVYQEMFGQLKGMSQDELTNASYLKMHGKRAVEAVSEFVNNLEDISGLDRVLKENGDSHFPRGIIPKHYSIFFNILVAFLGEALGDAFDESAKNGWTKAAEVMLGVVKTHYKTYVEEEGNRGNGIQV